MTLSIGQPNVMQVFEFRETPEPMIIMAYYPQGNIVNAGIIDDDRHVSAFGQVLDSLSHLHAKGVVHRDLKPENFLVEIYPLFKVVITDFGLAKVAADTTLLTTFCGSLMYMAPEVFPGLSDGHGSSVDVWSLGVIVFEWIYSVPELPGVPRPKKNQETVSPKKWYQWIESWATQLLDKLEDQDEDKMVKILLRMLEIDVGKRWPANKCLAQGFKSGFFKRRAADGLVVCASDSDGFDLPTEEKDDGTNTSLTVSLPQQTRADVDHNASIIQANL